MTKSRIFLIHGWGGSSNKDWFPWARTELEKIGYDVVAPDMPDADAPKIESWVNQLFKTVGENRSSDIFIGHSIGCQTILRYLEASSNKVDKVILVAPWLTLSNLESDEEWKVADPWLKSSINFPSISSKANKFIAIFSDTDPVVPYQENLQMFVNKLNPEVLTLHNHGHFTSDEGITDIPELLSFLS